MSAAAKAAWARAEAINPNRLMTVTERPDARAFVARFTTDEGLRASDKTSSNGQMDRSAS